MGARLSILPGLALSACLGAQVVPAGAAIIRVPDDLSTVQGAIDAANHGDRVEVAAGTYEERIDFLGKEIQVVGAGPDRSILDASTWPSIDRGGVVRFVNGEGPASELRGFLIRGGNADHGGGIAFYDSSPSVIECMIRDNSVSGGPFDGRGGGLSCEEYSNPALTRCKVMGNWAQVQGGGMNCSSSAPTLRNCMIISNSADGTGGGLCCEASSPTLTNCLITKNRSGISIFDDGGGIYCWYSSPILTNCTITKNVTTGLFGGGLYVGWGSSPELTNCILWGDSPDELYVDPWSDSSHPKLQYCNVEHGWSDDGEGVIDSDPNFRWFRGLRYVLGSESPSIDSGTGDDDSIPWSEIDEAYGIVNSPAPDMGIYGGPGAEGWVPDDFE